jgi:hypothetical protein
MASFPSLARSQRRSGPIRMLYRFLHAVAERGLLQFEEDNVSWSLSDVLTVVLLGWEPTRWSLRQLRISLNLT